MTFDRILIQFAICVEYLVSSQEYFIKQRKLLNDAGNMTFLFRWLNAGLQLFSDSIL